MSAKRGNKPFEGEDLPRRDGGKSGGAMISRRHFLGALATVGGTALIGSSRDVRARELEGWPNSYGLLTDLTLCVGCRSCEKACNEENGLPRPDMPFDSKGVFSEQRRPTASAYTVVNRFPDPRKKGEFIYRKVQCNHCNEPACFSACPLHAYTKTKEGAVLYDPDKCFGCRYCMVACPFYVPAYDYESALEPKIVKCTMCHHRISKGRPTACAEACPTGAVTFGRRKDLIALGREKIMKHPDRYVHHIFGEHEFGGTSWMYIGGVPFENLGFPKYTQKDPLVENTKGFLSAVPLVLTIWPALLGLCYAATRNKEEERGGKPGGHGEEDKHE
ncbi:MAG TPA: 4Fe-4S dicluster domain-containing protein [Dissulfurispiraceae bacterium]|nr:4Fe-4S dicluster domain-containing protein [Dissulfurispiraceae bacterium]